MRQLLIPVLGALFSVHALNISAQTIGGIDPTFNPIDNGRGDGFNEAVLAVASQPDGKMIVGGEFTTYNNIATPYLV